MTPPRIGSLFSGYGGLDMAVEAFFGARTAWHVQYEPPDKKGREDPHQFAAAILAHHYPAVPNHGDITAVDYARVEPVDILTGGFPCTDVSLAGKRAGLNDGTRSGLWAHMARAIAVLNPKLVVIENVRGLLSAPADGDVEPCTWCMGDLDGEPALRALGAVLADLAELGFDAEWSVYPRLKSAPLTSGSASSSSPGLPTPRARDWKSGGYDDSLSVVARLLPTPTTSEGSGTGRLDGNRNDTLRAQVAIVLLKTPTSQLAVNGGSQHPDKRKAGGHGPTLADEVEHLLPTPTAADSRNTARLRPDGTPYGSDGGPTLVDATRLLLPTPVAADGSRQSTTYSRGNPTLAGALLPTPRASDGAKGGPNQRGSAGDLTLPSAAHRIGAPTSRRSAAGSTPQDGQLPGQLTIEDASRPSSSNG